MSKQRDLPDWSQIDDHPIFRKKLLEKLNSPEQLDKLMTVTSGQAWLALLGLALLLGAGLAWSTLAEIASSVPVSGLLIGEDEAELEGVMYASVRDSQRIRVGQLVKLAPTSFRQEEYGLLYGVVERVSTRPANYGDMLASLHNEVLVQSMIADGLIVEVEVQLLRSDTPSGYRWTSAEGPPTTIYANTLANGNVVVAKQRPIALIWTH